MARWIPFTKSPPVVAVIRLQGTIGMTGNAINDPGIGPLIGKAFSKGKPVAVALEINSPGGSPVQSSLIAARIRRMSAEKGVPVFAFVEDVAASGGYWLATAAEEIFVDDSSIVGSIGVISAGFGVHALLEKNGIERRVYTAGTSKSMLDPFKPEQEEDVTRLCKLLDTIHDNFKRQVTNRRGSKLSEDDLFTGDIWVGQGGIDVGLADKIGHLVPTMKDRFGEDVKFRRYGPKKSFLRRFGAQLTTDALTAIEDRAAYARYGL